MSDRMNKKSALWQSNGPEDLDSVVKKITEKSSQYVTVWLDLDPETNKRRLVKVLNYIVEANLDVSLLLPTNLEELKRVLEAMEFLNRPQYDGRVRFLITHYPKSTDPNRDEQIHKIIVEAVQIITTSFKSCALRVFAPQFLTQEKEILSINPNAILSTAASEERYKKQKLDHLRWQRYCSGATLLWIDSIDSKESNVLSQVFTDHGVHVVKKHNTEGAIVYIISRPHLKNREILFRVMTNRERDNNPDAHLDAVEQVRNAGSLVPILVYSSSLQLELLNTKIFNYPRVRASNSYHDALNFGLMKDLLWAPRINEGVVESKPWSGYITIHDISCYNLEPKDANGLSDPYAILKLGKETMKTKVIMKTLQPKWHQLLWTIACNQDSEVNITLWDWDRLRADDFEGQITFKISDILKEIPIVSNIHIEKTFALQPRQKPEKVTKTLKKESSTKLIKKSKRTKSTKNPTKPKGTGPKALEKVKGTITIVIGLSSGEFKKRKHFGKPLKESLHIAKEDGVTHLIEGCVNALIKRGMKFEGLLRVPGNQAQIYNLREQIDQGKEIAFEREDCFDLAGLLKLYFYELPDSLFPENLYKEVEFLKYSDVEFAKQKLKSLFKQLPTENQNAFKSLMMLFGALISNHELTKMNSSAIITSIGPSIFLSRHIRDDPIIFLTATQVITNMGCFLIEHKDEIFD